jgi:hypothetical protein
MDGATHQYKGCIKSLLIVIGVEVFPGIQNHFIIDAFLLAIRVQTHVTKDTETKFSNLLSVVRKHNCLDICLRDNVVQSGNGRFAK